LLKQQCHLDIANSINPIASTPQKKEQTWHSMTMKHFNIIYIYIYLVALRDIYTHTHTYR
jgi:hypothetical protein